MLTLKDVAEELNCSETQARRIVRAHLPHFKIGGLVRLHKKDLDAYVLSCFRKPWG